MTRRILLLLLATFAVGATSLVKTEGDTSSNAAVAGCKGRVAVVNVSQGKYPAISAHIRSTQAHGASKTLRVNRAGASGRREHLLSWWQMRHPQPKGDGLDLDEQPPAMARATWKADVRPVPQDQNRSQGASMGGQLRGVPDGGCFRWRFTR